MGYEKPMSLEEMRDLKRRVTNLLREHEEAFVARKLRSMGLDPDAYQDHRARMAEAGELNPSTEATYARRGEALYRDAKERGVNVWALAESRAKTLSSWYAARAALQHVLRSRARAAKNDLDQWEKAVGHGKASAALNERMRRACEDLPLLATALESVPPEGVPAVFKQAGNGKRRKSSKARSLQGLPHDWQVTVANAMPPELRLAYLVQCVTGCRPAELNAVTVNLGSDGRLHAAVPGRKVRRNAGQPMRRMSLRPVPGVTLELAKVLRGGAGTAGPGLLDRTVVAYRRVVERRGQMLWGRRAAATRPTSYSVRHQFKSDAIHAGLSRAELAAAMGHRTEKSASYYGGGGKRAGAIEPTQVSATHAVKNRTKDYAALKAKHEVVPGAEPKRLKPR